jgi:hypothetical protein
MRLSTTLAATGAATGLADCCTSRRALRETSNTVTRPSTNQPSQPNSNTNAIAQAAIAQAEVSPAKDLLVREN